MLALIDADLLVFRVGFTTQDLVEGIALARLDVSIDTIKETLDTDQYQCILSPTDKSNFRYAILPTYKANRKTPRPVHYEALRQHLLEAHNATVAVAEEADDLLGILQTRYNTEGLECKSIICSIDKDLNQIAGNHFNFVTGEQYYVSPQEGLKWFYKQLLIGDVADNLQGIKGLGPVKAGKFLDDVTNEPEMYNIVSELYISEFGKAAKTTLLRNGQLFKIRTRKGELWQPPM